MEKSQAEAAADSDFRWRLAARRAALRWSDPNPCAHCGEWVGHRGPCPAIPLDVYLEEVRPGCVDVLRYRIGDAILAACDKKVVPCET